MDIIPRVYNEGDLYGQPQGAKIGCFMVVRLILLIYTYYVAIFFLASDSEPDPFRSSKVASDSEPTINVSGEAGHKIDCWLATARQEKFVSLKIINGDNPPRIARETCI